MTFVSDWHTMVEREKFADAVAICTPDRLHKVHFNVYSTLYFLSELSWIVVMVFFAINKPVCVSQEPAVAFAKKGYHVLLEKPMAVSVL